jgi:1-pyrroline-5-carboxylate dehydrogenase
MTTERVTYVSIGASPAFDEQFEVALASAEAEMPLAVGAGAPALFPHPASFSNAPSAELRAPADRRRVVARYEVSTAADVDRAVAAAATGYPAWRARPWQERVAIVRAAAERIVEHKFRSAALVTHEVGKTRLESMAEVEEAADLLRYYARCLEEADGYRRALDRAIPNEATESVLRPYGVWAVVSPFNFPMALAAGMIGGALLTGNTVVFKPSDDAVVSGALLVDALWAAGVPADALRLVLGGAEVGAALVGHADVSGVAFTGSFSVGVSIVRGMARDFPRPVIVEMGGKNPAIVTASADVDAAAVAVARSAFGYGGQKCSACSRVYVERAIAGRFVEGLVAAARATAIGPPERKATAVGPLIDERAATRFAASIERIRRGGGEILCGGELLQGGDFAHGAYAAATVATLRDGHELWDEELFLPILLVRTVDSLDEALGLANRSRFGLTAGLFASDPSEIASFLDGIEAGVVYVNRKSGATTGAWPGINPFGGWKGSGGTGVAALGPHYLLKFLREQSRAVSA